MISSSTLLEFKNSTDKYFANRVTNFEFSFQLCLIKYEFNIDDSLGKPKMKKGIKKTREKEKYNE